MSQELIPPTKHVAPTLEQADRIGLQEPVRRRFTLPVGVALGLVFSAMLIIICGLIIFYMAFSDRRIAGRLLDESASATIANNRAILSHFFDEQTLLFGAISIQANNSGAPLIDGDLARYETLLPTGSRLMIKRALATAVAAPADNAPVWTGFVYSPELREAVFQAEFAFQNGQRLLAQYPRSVFEQLSAKMQFDGRQNPFLLADRQTAIVVSGVPPQTFVPTAEAPLPALKSMTASPLHMIWEEQDAAHEMGGQVAGRVFPALGGMYTAIYEEIAEGPAKGWVLGALYRADQFGAALDQSRIVLYASALALLVGAVISFAIGRVLGRPLSRLAEASARIRDLDFGTVERLPSSRLAELDDVNSAFNGTLSALSAFARYVPRQLVSRLVAEGMTDPHQIEVRDMTIVFTDLAGFTSLASHLTAEQTAVFLNRYFETVSNAITAEDGTIDKYMGDGVMAFWGAPMDQPDHAEHAIAAVKALAKELLTDEDTDIRLRIGVHTGKVVVGNFGSSSRMNYTVIGDAVNIAARLQEYGKTVDSGAKVIVLASAETMSRLPAGTSATSIGSISLRGRDEATDVFRIA